MEELTNAQLDLLRSAAVIGWHVTADNLLDVAVLVRLGLVALEDDYDSIKVRATEAGHDHARELGIIVFSEGEWTFAPRP